MARINISWEHVATQVNDHGSMWQHVANHDNMRPHAETGAPYDKPVVSQVSFQYYYYYYYYYY